MIAAIVIEEQVVPLGEWLLGGGEGAKTTPSALALFLTTALALALAGVVIGYLVAALRKGPVEGAATVGRNLSRGLFDLISISPRRVLSLTMLAIREAMRRHIWVVLVIYLVMLMFAAWILNPGSDEPAKIYLSFVLTATTYLLLLLALFLAALSLPADITSRTIYTVVTKPVRSSEIVLGRMLGFILVATTMLLVMGISSYVFVTRALDHAHSIERAELTFEGRGLSARFAGKTSRNADHSHEVTLDAGRFLPEIRLAVLSDSGDLSIDQAAATVAQAGVHDGDVLVSIDKRPVRGLDPDQAFEFMMGLPGEPVVLEVRSPDDESTRSVAVVRGIAYGRTEMNKSHLHRFVVRCREKPATLADAELTFEVGPPEGMLSARVPKYGSLRFRSAQGEYTDKGISVGDMFSYRSYIEGNTLALAAWTFEGLRAEDFVEGLKLDLTVNIYRGHKGNVKRGLTGALVVRNPETKVRSETIFFTAREHRLNQIYIPRRWTDSKNRPVDLFGEGQGNSLVTADGRTEVRLWCTDRGQYFGLARPDLYLHAADAPFAMNFFKRHLEIWLQIVMVTALAVFFSTFLNGPIAMLSTITMLILGLNKSVLKRIVDHVVDPESMAETEAYLRWWGGGPFESLYRLLTQENLTRPLDPGLLTTVIKNVDFGLMWFTQQILHMLPDFESFGKVDYLANGYNIPADLVMQHVFTAAGFVVAAFVGGFFFFRMREIAK